MKKKLLSIINHYGVIPQLKYFQSEVFELNEAIIRHDQECYPNDEATEHIKEEIADVLVMLMQFICHYDLNTNEIERIFNYKIDRQIERIENEKSNS